MSEIKPFTLSPGQIIRRRELHAKFGGQTQGGISTPSTGQLVILITGDSGKQHGYSDEWTDDGVFLYTGEGQHGDMKFQAGNRAIRDHEQNQKTLQLFEQNIMRAGPLLTATVGGSRSVVSIVGQALAHLRFVQVS